MPKKSIKVPIAHRAVVMRVMRRLALDGQKLRTARGEAQRERLGHYYVVRIAGDVVRTHIDDLDAFAREIGALSAHEELVED